MADALDDTILAKTGGELFKELLRFYSVADPHDYFKSGKWDNPMLLRDVQLYFYHRSEAGAPDPTSLEDVKVPALPTEVVTKTNMTMVTPAATTAEKVASAAASAAATKERSASNLTALQATMAKLSAARLAGAAAGGTSTLKLGGAPTISAAGGAAKVAVAELKEIAMFVAKFKFEPARVKAILAKLDTNKRRYVIEKFASDSNGKEATDTLESYVTECEVSNDWDGFTAEPAAGGAAKPAGPKFTGTKSTLLAKPLLAGGIKPAAKPLLASSNILKRAAPAAFAAAAGGPKAKAPAIAVRPGVALRPVTGGK